MPVDKSGAWHPSLFPKQIEALQACLPSKKNLILLSGPRFSSKTCCALSAVCQHAWDTDRGNICVLTITQSVGIDSGVWTDLTEISIPEWIGGDFGMEWVKQPYIQNVTKKPACEVSNRHGNKTKISLESLKNEDEVEARFKGKRYSMIFVNELSKFKKRMTFDTLKQALRMMHLKEEEHLFLADTNPSEEGMESWIFKCWMAFRTMDDEQLREAFPNTPPETLIPLRDSLNLIEFTIDDNLACSPEKKASLMADFAHDPDLLDRYYYGRWVQASEDAIFYKVFRPDFHIVGEVETPTNPEPEIIVPHPNSFELISGLDPGVTNCSFHIIDKITPDEREYPQYLGQPIFMVLDELVVVGEDFDLEDFVEAMVHKMTYWESLMEKPVRVGWRHWSDRSAFDMKVAFSDKFWHQSIFQASGGKVTLMAADRGKGSVNQRIDLLRKLLYEERIFISRSKCPKTIEMLKSIKRGTTAAGGVAKGSVYKHCLDSLTYCLASECYDALARQAMLTLKSARKDSSSLVQVSL